MFSEPSWNCSRMKSCGWSTVTRRIIPGYWLNLTWFHAAGPATTNARSPNFVLVRWTTRSPRADDRVRPSTQDCSQSSERYTCADLCVALYIIRHSLNRMRCDTGSQCNRSRIKPETCEYNHLDSVWRTDWRTDRRTSCDGTVRAMHTRRAVKTIQNMAIVVMEDKYRNSYATYRMMPFLMISSRS